jgi:multicomponent Na+:H+ antiporter subunit E
MIARFVGLVALWIGLYGELSPANVVGGVLVAGVVWFATRDRGAQRVRIRPLGALALIAFMLVNLVRSSVRVLVAVWFPTPERTLAHVQTARLTSGSPTVAAVVANLITVTPGTMTVEVADDACEIQVHILGAVTTEAFVQSVAELEQRVVKAVRPVVHS